MTFKIPSPLFYLGTLLLSALLAGLAFWLLRLQGLDANSLVVLGAGVVIGHLIGSCVQPSARRSSTTQSTPASHQGSEPVPTGDSISLYVGNLAYNAQRNALRDLFAEYGQVNSVRIMTDRTTRRPRGYGFVDMEANAGRRAMSALDNTEFCGRNLKVSEAQQREENR
ncbi:MAG: RNA-binding protein [Gammaproteobacteria bacterium]|nr:RNA-binding protein [Gammaproteobacteria bacterium]